MAPTLRPKGIQGGTPYAEHLLEAGGTKQGGQSQREGASFCFVGNTPESAVPAAA